MLNRRQLAVATMLGMASPAIGRTAQDRKRIALIGTTVYEHSHAQHFLDRFSIGYAMAGKWREPRADLAAVYIDQFGAKDVGRQRIAKYGLRQCESIEEALTLGQGKLSVDGVVLIGEHGDYPKNEKGQTLYPRYQWFQELVRVFAKYGRAVPVFNDKHLSTDWPDCKEMVTQSQQLKFPLYAGSSLPVTWRLPALEMPWGTPLKESVCVAYGGVDSYDFHALETAQCMSERRAGGEVGIGSVLALRGEDAWQTLAGLRDTRKLFLSALCRSHSLPVQTGYPSSRVTFDWARRTLPSLTAYFVEHLDGFRTSIFLTGIRDFNYAGMRSDNGEIIGCQMMLPMPGRNATTADFFNPLTHHVEEMFVTGETEYPVERTLLTSGMVIGGVESLSSGSRFETTDMAIAYQAPKRSFFWNV